MKPETLARRTAACAVIAASMLGGCTWIKLSDAGAAVAQATPDAVAHCQLVGRVTSKTQNRVLLERSPGKVREELIVMARNEAPGLGGDTIVPAGPMEDGEQVFHVYRCR
jgi:hypothetical protein